MISIDVVCPIYKNINQIKNICESLKKQEKVKIKKIVFPHTLCDDEGIDNEIREVIKPYISFELKKSDFSHSLTREKAVRDYCDSNIVVFLSQDIEFYDNNSIFNLVNIIDDNIVYAYGRQLCKNRSIEKYIRKKNYGKESKIIEKSNIDDMQLMAFFASDAFSAINREKFIELNGYRGYDVMMNEDQLYSLFILEAGYKKMYVSDAMVYHSHKYKLKQLYNRYYETGVFYKNIKLFDGYKSTNTGFKLAFYVLGQALIHFNIPVLFRWLPDMAARYLGMKKGRR